MFGKDYRWVEERIKEIQDIAYNRILEKEYSSRIIALGDEILDYVFDMDEKIN